jgi:hypothetical protein
MTTPIQAARLRAELKLKRLINKLEDIEARKAGRPRLGTKAYWKWVKDEAERKRDVWQATLRDAWLRDHPGKTLDDYEFAGSCGDTAEGERAWAEWYAEWAAREGEAIRLRLFGGES